MRFSIPRRGRLVLVCRRHAAARSRKDTNSRTHSENVLVDLRQKIRNDNFVEVTYISMSYGQCLWWRRKELTRTEDLMKHEKYSFSFWKEFDPDLFLFSTKSPTKNKAFRSQKFINCAPVRCGLLGDSRNTCKTVLSASFLCGVL